MPFPSQRKSPPKRTLPKEWCGLKAPPTPAEPKKNPDIPFNDEERPVHKVTVSGFYLDEHEVTNAQFGDFVDATGYKTQAEKGWSKIDFPKAPPEALKPGGIVFSGPPRGG